MKYLKLIIGCLLIAIGYNLFVLPNNYVSFGTDGMAILFKDIINIPIPLIILIINMIIIFVSLLINMKNTYKYLIPSLLIPLFMVATSYFNVSLELPEQVLTILVSSIFIGFGYAFIYQSGYKAGTIYLIEEDLGDFTKIHTQIYSAIVDILIIMIFVFQQSYQAAIYSLFIVVVTRMIINKARYNINDSKMFYVITSKEKEVKHYIMSTLGYELTELDVKGGFTQEKKSIILSVISAKDYYKLKTGIMDIDKHAFVAITDTYDVINRKAF